MRFTVRSEPWKLWFSSSWLHCLHPGPVYSAAHSYLVKDDWSEPQSPLSSLYVNQAGILRDPVHSSGSETGEICKDGGSNHETDRCRVNHHLSLAFLEACRRRNMVAVTAHTMFVMLFSCFFFSLPTSTVVPNHACIILIIPHHSSSVPETHLIWIC